MVSSAENGKPAGRLVVLTEADFNHPDDQFRILVAQRFLAAPADPAEVVRCQLVAGPAISAEASGEGDSWLAHAICEALGVPQRPTPRDETPS